MGRLGIVVAGTLTGCRDAGKYAARHTRDLGSRVEAPAGTRRWMDAGDARAELGAGAEPDAAAPHES